MSDVAIFYHDPRSRGRVVHWPLVDKMLERPSVERTGTLSYGSYEDTINALESAISPGPFILGERFSAADVYIGSQIHWGLRTKSLEPRPSLCRATSSVAPHDRSYND